MDLKQLRQFVTLAEERHFTRAAERLGMAQPPLTMAIQKLEVELGASLFTRTHRRVDLTPVGAALYPEAQAILARAAGLPAIARRTLHGEIGTLRLS
jgi:DNA-binding transcriptional LysR family regulator